MQITRQAAGFESACTNKVPSLQSSRECSCSILTMGEDSPLKQQTFDNCEDVVTTFSTSHDLSRHLDTCHSAHLQVGERSEHELRCARKRTHTLHIIAVAHLSNAIKSTLLKKGRRHQQPPLQNFMRAHIVS